MFELQAPPENSMANRVGVNCMMKIKINKNWTFVDEHTVLKTVFGRETHEYLSLDYVYSCDLDTATRASTTCKRRKHKYKRKRTRREDFPFSCA